MIEPMQIGMPYGSSSIDDFRSAAIAANCRGSLIVSHSIAISQKFW